MMKFFVGYLKVIICALFLSGAVCTPVSPPAFAPSKSLYYNNSANSLDCRVYGGAAHSIFLIPQDLHGAGGGIELEYRDEHTGIGITASKVKGEGPYENNNSVSEVGGFFTYYYKMRDWWILAFEPRFDMAIISNGSRTVIPNFILHSSFLSYPWEGKITLRGGISKVLERGELMLVKKEIIIPLLGEDREVYTYSYLRSSFYLSYDKALIYRFKKMYLGAGLGLIIILDKDHHGNIWLYPEVIFGHDF